jgi:CheY-like chemotaxis protein
MDKKIMFDILLVEDNPADSRLIEIALRNGMNSVRLSLARDGVKAMEILHRVGEHRDAQVPDLILLDLNLPKKDGREVLNDIKNDPKLRSIPVVILTSSDAQRDIIESYNMHANCYIVKPMDLNDLMNVIKYLEIFWLKVVKLPGGNSIESN